MNVPSFLRRTLGSWSTQVALRTPDRTFTYQDLDRLTRAVATRIRAVSADTPDGTDRVVVLGHHSVESVLAALGALRSGLTYTPINPELPRERVGRLIGWLHPAVVVATDESWREAIRTGPSTRWLWPHLSAAEFESSATPDLADRPGADIAYSILTSGSTGEPKLVNVSADGIGDLCRAQADAFQLGPGVSLLQFASLAFDASVAEILAALGAGATLCLPERGTHGWLSSVDDYLREHPVDVATLPPSVHRALSRTAQKHIRTTVFVGEVVTERDFERARDHGRVFNAYGPTEATVCATLGEMTTWSESIGRAIGDFDVLVGPDLAPEGSGELVLRGRGVALGYEGVDSPAFGLSEGRRFYRTGDLGTVTPDGEVLYHGRLDAQIKRLGHRTSRPELEHRWNRVLDADARCVETPDRRILLVLASAGTDSGSTMTLLRRHLAPWEVPDEIVVVPSLPLLVSGKLDVERILAVRGQTGTGVAEILGRGAAQSSRKVVVSIVNRVLGYEARPDVTIFDQGSDSLDFVTLQTELCATFGDELVDEIFDAHGHDFVVDDMVAALDQRLFPANAAKPVPPAPADEPGSFGWADNLVDAFVASLPPAVADMSRRCSDTRVVVTGASGFIGGHLVDRMRHGRRPVVVASTSGPDAVRQNLARRFGDTGASVVALTDLTPAAAGGNAEPTLAGATVLHAGFDVNHAMPMTAQWTRNVEPTFDLLRASLVSGARHFCFLSAGSAGQEFRAWGPEAWTSAEDPYSRAKLLCEEAVRRVRGRGMTTSILRLPLVYGHRRPEGEFLTRNVFASIIKGSLAVGALPPISGAFSVCAVDTVSDVVCAAVQAATDQDVMVRQAQVGAESIQQLAGGRLEVWDHERWLRAVERKDVLPRTLLARIHDVLPLSGDQEAVAIDGSTLIADLPELMGADR